MTSELRLKDLRFLGDSHLFGKVDTSSQAGYLARSNTDVIITSL